MEQLNNIPQEVCNKYHIDYAQWYFEINHLIFINKRLYLYLEEILGYVDSAMFILLMLKTYRMETDLILYKELNNENSLSVLFELFGKIHSMESPDFKIFYSKLHYELSTSDPLYYVYKSLHLVNEEITSKLMLMGFIVSTKKY